MSILLPPTGSPAREAMGTLEHVANVLAPGNRLKLLTMREAQAGAIAFLAASPAASHVNAIVIRVNGDFELMEFGPKGGKRTLWNFSK